MPDLERTYVDIDDFAALRAISDLCSGVSNAARAFPPFDPSDMAA
ncbi:hypothetical protein [Roseisalinus antarcticus]|uniref:Uncharacterized protein n=1 Tax=Roseisalinus antarcticus TaxID=254357 RepID=A0A1Y5RFI1_9RHOB|nr:hypothetical protein [Roseisalinus antarcticus]SLN15007.1 hypothetical protein ROA7023_00166 [Roseisalinus antarcticus]